MQNMTSFIQTRGFSYGVKHILAPRSGPLDQVLQSCLEIATEQAQDLLNLGAIYLNNSRLKNENCNLWIEKDSYLRVHQTPRRFPIEHFNYPENLIYEDENLIVINKASGLPVHPTVDNTQENILHLLEITRKEKLFITHRLDTATSGLIIFAKNPEAQTIINHFLFEGKIRKIYTALVHGDHVKLGMWQHYMQPSPRAPKKVSATAMPGWADCRLQVLDQNILPTHRWQDSNYKTSEILIELMTGRTHQIRAQLGFAGNSIFGDTAYGSPVKISNYEQICLQATSLQFPKPDNPEKILSFKIPTRPWSNILKK